MKINLDEFRYRLRTDQRFKKRMKKLVVLAGVGLLLIVAVGVVGLILLSSAIIGLVYTHAPAVYEMVFNTAREFASAFMLHDINALLQPLTANPYGAEMQNLVNQYFEQLGTNPAIDFQNFQNFTTTVKNSLLDNQVTPAELELVRGFLLH
ncbi:MAG TPA: hypothetical protein VLH61_05475 [Bacteroidales bacterium]|nr:hypothetical protein [Bacteroidales bacterium]